MITVQIWTDGAITGNGKAESVGAWAAILQMAGREKIITGVKHSTTNNEMELMAIYEALKALNPEHAQSTIYQLYSDSEYCVKAFQYRAARYEFDGWQLKPNINLIRAIYELNKTFNVQFHSIPREDNERADAFAKAAKEEELIRIGWVKKPSKQTKARSKGSVQNNAGVVDGGSGQVSGEIPV